MADEGFYKIEDIKEVNIKALLKLLRGRTSIFSFFDSFTTEARYISAILRSWPILKEYGFTTPRRLTHFLGQAIVETGQFTQTEESFKYRIGSLMKYHGHKFRDREEAKSYLGDEKRLANKLYAGKIGNGDEESGDGWRYRGRGIIQLTGRDNYRHFGELIGLPLEDKPDLLTKDLRNSVKVAAAFFVENGILEHVDSDNIPAVSRAINRGSAADPLAANHEKEREEWTNAVRDLFDNPAQILDNESVLELGGTLRIGSRGGDVEVLQGLLLDLGYNTGKPDGRFGPNTESAVKNFQRANGLAETGIVDGDMVDLMEQLIEERGGPLRPGASYGDMKRAGVKDPGNTKGQATGAAVAGTSGTAIAAETGAIGAIRESLEPDPTEETDTEVDPVSDDATAVEEVVDSGAEADTPLDEDRLTDDIEALADDQNAVDEPELDEPPVQTPDGATSDAPTEETLEDAEVTLEDTPIDDIVDGEPSLEELASDDADTVPDSVGEPPVKTSPSEIEAPPTEENRPPVTEIVGEMSNKDSPEIEVFPVPADSGEPIETEELPDIVLTDDDTTEAEADCPTCPCECADSAEAIGTAAPVQTAETLIPPRDPDTDDWNYTAISLETAGVAIGAYLIQRARGQAHRRREEFRDRGRVV